MLVPFSTPKSLQNRFLGGLGVSWGRLGGVWGCLGGVLDRLGGVLGRLGGVLGRLKASWKHLGIVLGPSWRDLGGLTGSDENRVPDLQAEIGSPPLLEPPPRETRNLRLELED